MRSGGAILALAFSKGIPSDKLAESVRTFAAPLARRPLNAIGECEQWNFQSENSLKNGSSRSLRELLLRENGTLAPVLLLIAFIFGYSLNWGHLAFGQRAPKIKLILFPHGLVILP